MHFGIRRIQRFVYRSYLRTTAPAIEGKVASTADYDPVI
jgi:hypothetical protein